MLILEYVFNRQYCATVILYVLITFFSTLFAMLSQNHNKFKKIPFITSFLILWFFFVFTTSGTDLSNYLNVFETSNFSKSYFYTGSIEIGYKFINALLHLITQNSYVGVGIIKTIILILFYRSFYLLKDKVKIGYSVLAFVSLFYFQSFNLIRLALAGSLCYLAFSLLLSSNKKIPSVILCVVAYFIHKSSIFFIYALLVYFISSLIPSLKKMIAFLIIVSIPLVLFFFENISNYILGASDEFARYEGYLTIDGTIGIAQILFYLPVFITLKNLAGSKILSTKNNNLLFIFSIIGFEVAMIGYANGMISRAAIYFMENFSISLPFCLNYKIENRLNFNKKTKRVLLIGYFILRFILTLSSIFIPSGISQYGFVF